MHAWRHLHLIEVLRGTQAALLYTFIDNTFSYSRHCSFPRDNSAVSTPAQRRNSHYQFGDHGWCGPHLQLVASVLPFQEPNKGLSMMISLQMQLTDTAMSCHVVLIELNVLDRVNKHNLEFIRLAKLLTVFSAWIYLRVSLQQSSSVSLLVANEFSSYY